MCLISLFFQQITKKNMAEGGAIPKSVLKETIECPICFETFSDPRCLPCQHAFCFNCLQQCVQNAAATFPRRQFQCPLCKADTPVPGGDVNNFPRHFLINNLLEMNKSTSVAPATAATALLLVYWKCIFLYFQLFSEMIVLMPFSKAKAKAAAVAVLHTTAKGTAILTKSLWGKQPFSLFFTYALL